ncbi:MAG: Zinc transporter, ZIP family [Candidatus Gottesmanbacteria bacterium GW2011_GWA2_43_14]|uniref:Zinc transporter, ZIP family n=1 Tax=Candidatus Gottesmanbacteria bacterium GW2011_GWA2_43_14 TaxID=1618443 RepID=A0A0G1DLK1_9BACT|nr:MAG: Zinc transporter, ZIP family [Candidatus Gottesmanbacteria bacterium GW2011_GWA2_43_14]
MLFNIVLFTILGSIFSLIGGLILLTRKQLSDKVILILTSFAAGVLLSTAFFDLFPESLESGTEPTTVFTAALTGIILFFIFERFFLWYHHHHGSHKGVHPSTILISVGDGIHNFIDGVAIAGAFLVSWPLGVITSIAVAAHEIPQEIADFSIMLSEKVERRKIVFFNLASAGTSLVGAVGTYFLAETVTIYLPIIIAFTAGMFTYIASSDLIPELHRSGEGKEEAWQQLTVFLIGIILIFVVKSLLHEG